MSKIFKNDIEIDISNKSLFTFYENYINEYGYIPLSHGDDKFYIFNPFLAYTFFNQKSELMDLYVSECKKEKTLFNETLFNVLNNPLKPKNIEMFRHILTLPNMTFKTHNTKLIINKYVFLSECKISTQKTIILQLLDYYPNLFVR